MELGPGTLYGALDRLGADGLIMAVGVLSLLDPAWISWDPRRQALYDKVARTVVVQAGPGIPNPYRDWK